MYRFTLRDESGQDSILFYDQINSTLRDETGADIDVLHLLEENDRTPVAFPDAPTVSKETPLGKTRKLKMIRVQLGLSCNYSCTYCSQRFVPHATAGGTEDVVTFLAKLPSWYDGGDDGKGAGTQFEFWGGEPFVYWKRMKPLAEGIRKLYPNSTFRIFTNGSLLDDEKIEWLDEMGFSVGLSHDGPGQSTRGPDPFDDPEKFETIMKLYHRLAPKGRMSFNVVLTRFNHDFRKIQYWFSLRTGIPRIMFSEGDFVTPYDDGGISTSPLTDEEYQRIMWTIIEASIHQQDDNVMIIRDKVTQFFRSLRDRRPAQTLGQKCGMDRPDRISVDLKGNVLTCQNVSVVAKAPNGASHRIGHIDDFDNIKLNSATHWKFRPNCSKCPVLHLCRGTCMFLEGNLFDIACKNAFYENLAYLTVALFVATGKILIQFDEITDGNATPFALPA